MASIDYVKTSPARTGGVLAILATLRLSFAQRAEYRRTVRELSALGDRELADLGLSRGAIRGIAHEAVYGR